MSSIQQTPHLQPEYEQLTVSPAALVGYFGFTVFCAWTFSCYLSPSFSQEFALGAFGQQGHLLNRFAMMTPLGAVLLFAWRCSDLLSRKQGFNVMLVTAAVCAAGSFVCFLLNGDSVVLRLAGWALAGIFQGLSCVLWSTYLCFIGERRILLFVAFCVGAGGVLAVLLALLQLPAAMWIVFSLSLLTLAAIAYYHLRLDKNTELVKVASRLSDKRSRIQKKSAFAVVLYSMVLGFFVCFLVGRAVFPVSTLVGSLAIFCAGALVMVDTIRFHIISETLITKLMLPVTLLGVIPLFIDSLVLQLLCCFVLLVFFMVVYIVNLASISEHTRIYQLSPVRLFGFARIENVVGFLLGVVGYYLAFLQSGFGISGQILTVLVMLLVLACGVSFVFEDHYPLEGERLRRASREPREHHLPSTKMVELTNISSGDETGHTSKSFWMRRCELFAQHYELSPKEHEVLLLLARGRNAQYIQETLVVSKHTAKAHIYHIYQKSNVHSRQELIDKLEEMLADEPK